jgi:hypothetical protein
MTQVGRKHGRGAEAIIAEAKHYLGPERTAQRERDIAALPTVPWKGRTLYTLRCQGISGKGPHDVNVPLALVWHLVDLRRFFCPYHAGDAMRVGQARKRDTNEPAIVEALTQLGAVVFRLSAPGCPDLLVGWRGNWLPMEVKSATGTLTPMQQVLTELTDNGVPIVRSVDDALMALKVLR